MKKSQTFNLALPPLKTFCDSSAKDQVLIWRRANEWLSESKRAQANRMRSPKPKFSETKLYLEAIERYWNQLLKEAQENPDFFEWPRTKIWIGNGFLSADSWSEEGVLKTFGYSVDQDENLPETKRRLALDSIFSLSIPPLFNISYLREWGKPETPLRLKKMANCLASFARNAKHRNQHSYQTAIGRWEADLKYLKEEYYLGKFKFDFPNTIL